MQHNDISEDKEIDVAKVGQVSTDGSQCGSVYSDDGTAPTLTAGTHGDANSKVCTEYRIMCLSAIIAISASKLSFFPAIVFPPTVQ